MPITREHQHRTKTSMQGDKVKYQGFLAAIAIGQRVGVRMSSGAVVIDTIDDIIRGEVILVACHNSSNHKQCSGPIVRLRSHGTYMLKTGAGLFAPSQFLLPATPALERSCATSPHGEDSIAGRLQWFSAQLWEPEDAIRFFAFTLSIEAKRHDHGWLENHFARRDDRETTLAILRRAYPDHHALIDELITPWYQRWLDEMGGAEQDAKADANAIRHADERRRARRA